MILNSLNHRGLCIRDLLRVFVPEEVRVGGEYQEVLHQQEQIENLRD